MSIVVKGMKMPKTGLYFVSVDNTNGRDKTVITVERMLGNRDIRQIVGSFELIPVPPHGDLIDRDALKDAQQADADFFKGSKDYGEKCRYDEAINAVANIVNAPTIIQASDVTDTNVRKKEGET